MRATIVLLTSLLVATDGRNLVTIDTWFSPAPRYSYGNATWYDVEVMEATANWRRLSLDEYLDGVALMSPADIGKTVWLRKLHSRWEGPYLSVDASSRGDMWKNVMVGREVVEIGFRTAVRWNLVTSEGEILEWQIENVEVYIGDNKPSRVRNPISYTWWWSGKYELATRYEWHPIFIPPSSWNMRDGRILHHSDFTNPSFDFQRRKILMHGKMRRRRHEENRGGIDSINLNDNDLYC